MTRELEFEASVFIFQLKNLTFENIIWIHLLDPEPFILLFQFLLGLGELLVLLPKLLY